MGYYIETTDINFIIPTDKLAEAYTILCELNSHNDLKSGGSYDSNGKTAWWFAWMPENYPETCADAQAIFEELGFETELTDTGLSLLQYDSKAGSEDIFINAVGHLVSPDSFIEWLGEDGARTRWTPAGTQNGSIIWN